MLERYVQIELFLRPKHTCQLLLNRDGSFDNGIVQVFRTASAGHLHDQPRGRSIELLSSGPIPHWSAPKIEMMQ